MSARRYAPTTVVVTGGDPVHLAMFLHRFDRRAVSRVVSAVSDGLVTEGAAVTILATTIEPEARESLAVGVHLERVPTVAVDRSAFALPSVVAALRRTQPDVVFSHGNGPNRAAVVARTVSRADTSVVTVEHQQYSSFIDPRGGGYRFAGARNAMTGMLYRRADLVGGVSPDVVADLVARFAIDRDRTVVLPPPAPNLDHVRAAARADVIHPWYGTSARIISCVANVIPRKGQHVLVEALRRVRDHVGDVRVVFVGRRDNAAYAERVNDVARRSGVADAVSFAGYQENPLPWIAHSDAFALTSFNEGFGMVLAEAMALGVPVVASDCPSGPAYVLDGGRAGELVPVGDARATADALIAVLSGTDHAATLRARGLERVKEFSRTNVVRRYLDAAATARGRVDRRPRRQPGVQP